MALEEYKLKHGTIKGFPGARAWDGAKEGPLIEAKCDILGACAKEKVRKTLFYDQNKSIFEISRIWQGTEMPQ